MNISILCSSENHPVNDMLQRWINTQDSEHSVSLVRKKAELEGGDILFLISCNEIVTQSDRSLFKKSLVIHASDLPRGRGWSPHIWEVIDGASEITVTLLEASENIDSGDIWEKIRVSIPKHTLFDEINKLLFDAEFQLMNFAVANFNRIQSKPQDSGIEPTYYSRRQAEDSELNPQRSIAEQFDLIRVCDSNRFPAFFRLRGYKYKLTIEKVKDE